MRKICNLKQSSKSKLGACYGYSFFWAKGKLTLPENAKEKEQEIPLTEAIECVQWSQFIPSAKSEWIPDVYMDWNEEAITKDIQKMLVNNGDAVILKYFGLIAGHALSIKKIDDGIYHYFDCNDGIYEFSDEEFPAIIKKVTCSWYSKLFYGFGLEKVSADTDFEPSIIKNIFAVAFFFCAKILTSPIGAGRLAFTLYEILADQCDKLIKGLSDFISTKLDNHNTETVAP
ncbi:MULTISPECIES: hypothetical protein [Legionella]|uniref:Peptidase C58 YopT-type domain-containing protein n=1 Tax=Legionella resiliens TaxID=2905958 RepID=A0ABS8X6G9_9GAMM|nr:MULTISPECIES: hypothetical protein [unclassified Legionella]MCE0724009.1 hypothetical protein [Legionella sp. 9fVS26]MCE3533162.1 hypothetical protein [Legionella sp. 8cVS16]QLZ69341.1 hypothetical protein FOLKNPGA_02124 [Legionella sp. PC1000]